MAEEQTVDHATENVEEVAEKTFSQEDVNRVGKKEHKSGYAKAIKDLGFADVESAKEALKAYEDWQESQKTEADKQTELLASKDRELTSVLDANKRLEAKLSALTQGVNADSVDDVIALSERLVNEDTTIDEAIKQVVGKYPQFATTPNTTEKKPTFTVVDNPSASTKSDVSKDQFGKMTYVERLELKRTNPKLYEQLKGN
ncbi:hypothetical protein HO572_01290 [Streptococcus suis]|uniref:hypothetical protein n=1 Tax=Streptococcus suis TaxID=1307 RepID=UPI0005CCD2D9|nr:hypothetical protein [Streptococcus suis]MBM6460347.1 hypothetical protein [Streptococcus suis]MBM7286768.1 hypothetical protein [Streptococcus suis]MBO4137920.1 hypothetical protein [Streptococcus suis]MBO8112157.1 hypothetical protein [Streptococcus suis]MBS0719940.1 hypothetical protein [Streptococcus suis]